LGEEDTMTTNTMTTAAFRYSGRSASRAILWASALAACALLAAAGLAACGDEAQGDGAGGGGGGGGGGGEGASCTSNAECAEGFACVSGSASALTLPEGGGGVYKDLACFQDCAFACDFADEACLAACVATCDPDPGPGPGPDPDPDDVGGGGADMGFPGGDLGGGGGGGGGGVCRAVPTTSPDTGGSDAGGNDVGGNDPDTAQPQPIDWAGTWSARVVYTAVCQWGSAGSPNNASIDERMTVRVTGSGGSYSAVFDNNNAYTMTGPGNASRLVLSGQFAGRDHRGTAATTVRRDNNVDVLLDDIVDNDTARGSLSGSYDTSGGIGCRIAEGGTIELSR
jgi:hypothetical protein